MNGTLDGIVRGARPLILNIEMSFNKVDFVGVPLVVDDLLEELDIALCMGLSIVLGGVVGTLEFAVEQREVVLRGVDLAFDPSFETARVSIC
jgi:hypothetical protein